HLERIERPVIPSQPLRLAAFSPQNVADCGSDYSFKNRIPLGDLQKLICGIISPASALARVPDPDAHQIVHVLVWERIEHDGMNDAVDRRRGHNAERQRKNGNKSDVGRLRQMASPEPRVTHKLSNPVEHLISSRRDLSSVHFSPIMLSAQMALP